MLAAMCARPCHFKALRLWGLEWGRLRVTGGTPGFGLLLHGFRLAVRCQLCIPCWEDFLISHEQQHVKTKTKLLDESNGQVLVSISMAHEAREVQDAWR